MTLKLKPASTFTNTVELVDMEGERHFVEFTFNHMKKPAYKALMLPEEGKPGKTDHEVMMVLVHGWNPSHIDAPFNAENMAELLDNYHVAAKCILKSFNDGVGGAKLGNSVK